MGPYNSGTFSDLHLALGAVGMHLGNDVTFPVESMSLHGYGIHGLLFYSRSRLPYFLSSSMQLYSVSISCYLSSSKLELYRHMHVITSLLTVLL